MSLYMGGLKSRIKNSTVIFLILSVFVHLCTLGVINIRTVSTKLQEPVAETLEFEIHSSIDQANQQIVEQDEKAINDETPEDTKYLSRHNQRVVKETRSANFGDFKNTAGQGQNPNQVRTETSKPKEKSESEQQDDGTLPSLASLNPKFDFSDRRNTHATQESDSAPPSATNDHLKDTEPSIQTMLNSREFVYYTYYQRIRSQIRQHWEPSIREKVRRIFAQGRSIASTRDHVTRVIIILNKEGELIGVQIVGQSGVKDLDDAAVEAFRAAQPFPNPPKGIVETDGTIKINWDFILES